MIELWAPFLRHRMWFGALEVVNIKGDHGHLRQFRKQLAFYRAYHRAEHNRVCAMFYGALETLRKHRKTKRKRKKNAYCIRQ